VPTAAKPAETAASLATCFTVEALGRMDFVAFVGRLAFVVLLLFDLAPARFRLVFDLTRRFDEAFDLARFFAFFMIFLIRYSLVQIGPQSVYWQAGRELDFLPPTRRLRAAGSPQAKSSWPGSGR
jgi:predicted ferric reductase